MMLLKTDLFSKYFTPNIFFVHNSSRLIFNAIVNTIYAEIT